MNKYIKYIVSILMILFLWLQINYAEEIGDGSGSSYPNYLDTDSIPLVAGDAATIDFPNDLAEAVVKIQEELGVLPSGSYDTIVLRMSAIDTATNSISSNYFNLSDSETVTGNTTFDNAVYVIETSTLFLNKVAAYSGTTITFTDGTDVFFGDDSIHISGATDEVYIATTTAFDKGNYPLQISGAGYLSDYLYIGSTEPTNEHCAITSKYLNNSTAPLVTSTELANSTSPLVVKANIDTESEFDSNLFDVQAELSTSSWKAANSDKWDGIDSTDTFVSIYGDTMEGNLNMDGNYIENVSSLSLTDGNDDIEFYFDYPGASQMSVSNSILFSATSTVGSCIRFDSALDYWFDIGPGGYAGLFDSSDTIVMIVEEGGNVGIGTSTPSSLLDVAAGGAANENTDVLTLSSGDSGADTQTSLIFDPTSSMSAYIRVGGQMEGGGDVGFWVNTMESGVLGNNDFVVTGTGKVGIGTTTVSEKLDVNGNAKINGYMDVSNNKIINLSTISFTDGTYMTSTTTFAGGGTVGGDDLGNHIATTTLNMGWNDIESVQYIKSTRTVSLQADTNENGSGGIYLYDGGNMVLFTEPNSLAITTPRTAIVPNDVSHSDEIFSIEEYSGASHVSAAIVSSNTTTASVIFGDRESENQGRVAYYNPEDRLEFYSNSSKNMVIQSDGDIDVNNNKIINLSTPTANFDAATKKYVDDSATLNVGFYVWNSNNQSLPNETWTNLNYNQENFDLGNDFDTAVSSFTVPTDGYYMITLAVSLSAEPTSIIMQVRSDSNATLLDARTNDQSANETLCVYLNSGTRLFARVQQTSGGALTTPTNKANHCFQAVLISK